MNTLIFFFTLLKTSLKASMGKRGAFLFQSGLMVANNLIFFAIWWIFFQKFDHVAGWQFMDMLVLMTVGLSGYGVTQICFGGVKSLSRIIMSGDLDSFMTQPKNVLLHIAGSRSYVKGWGHIMTACVLLFLGNITCVQTLLVIGLSTACACLVFTSTSVIAHSLPFWLGSVEGLSKKYCDSLFLFSLYPTNMYSGVLELVMFTVIPAGVIGYLPVELIRNFSWIQLGVLVASTLSFVVLAFVVFYTGLKRYESGNKFGMRV